MKILQKIIFSLILLTTVIHPHQVFAQTSAQTEQCNELRQQFQSAGGGEIIGTLPQYCSTGSLYTKFLNFALFAVGIVAVITIIYGGYLYMTAQGNEAQRKKGSSVLTWAVIGVVIVLIAAVIVNVVIRAIVENRFV